MAPSEIAAYKNIQVKNGEDNSQVTPHRLPKVEILRRAIEYIERLEEMLNEEPEAHGDIDDAKHKVSRFYMSLPECVIKLCMLIYWCVRVKRCGVRQC